MIVNPHKKRSEKVSKENLPVVISLATKMITFCIKPSQNFKLILALAHPQVEKKNPLQFFVTNEKEIIINPIIIKHTRHTVDSLEGCISFPNNSNIIVQRWNKCVVNYQIINANNQLSDIIEESISGQRAKMFQHEIQHFEGKYIYDTIDA